MTIDMHSIVTGLLGIVCGILGWLGRALWTAVDNMRKDLSALEVRIGTDYIRYDRLQDVMAPIVAKLDRIEAVLMNKADK